MNQNACAVCVYVCQAGTYNQSHCMEVGRGVREGSRPRGGGGTASLRVGTQNKTTDPRYHKPLSLPLLIYCYYCCYHDLPPVDIISSCPDTITLITVAKTLIIASPGCFHWTSQANIYSPNKKCPSDSPPSESSWACESPLFSSLQPQLRESILQWVPKTRVSAPPPPPRGRSRVTRLTIRSFL